MASALAKATADKPAAFPASAEPPSPKWALATKAGSPCGLAERSFLKIPRGYLKNPSDMGEGHANDHEGCDLS